MSRPSLPDPPDFDPSGLHALLADFVASDSRRSERAAERLAAEARRFVLAHLRRNGAAPEDAEEAAQETVRRFLAGREQFENRGPNAWLGWLSLTGRRLLVDQVRRRGREAPLEEETEARLPAAGPPEADRALDALSRAAAVGNLLHEADRLWLGFDQSLRPRDIVRRVLAAQWYYLDGLEPGTVRRTLAAVPPGPSPDRYELDTWLIDPAVLRGLACQALYMTGDELAVRALLREEPTPEARRRLLALDRAANPPWPDAPPPWRSWPETRVALWRLRHGLAEAAIGRRADCPLAGTALRAAFERSACLMPFESLMTDLLDSINRRSSVDGVAALAARGLWQRLAFQFCYVDELPHSEIHARLVPAAELVGMRLTAATLNNWLSDHRLLRALARRCDATAREEASRG